MRPKHPKSPDLSSCQLGWTIMKLYMYQFTSGSPSKSPTVNQHIPMLHASPILTKYRLQVPLVLDIPHHSTKGVPSFPFQHQCLTNTNSASQQTCGPLELLTSIADCDQSFRSANVINCDQSDSTHSFHL